MFEYQSCEDKWMKFRLLGYMVRIWEKFRKEKPEGETLPVIIPLIYDKKGDGEFVLSSFAYALQAEEVDKDQIDDIFSLCCYESALPC